MFGVTGRQESPGYTSRVGKRFKTCSYTKDLYCKDLKLKKEEEGKGEKRVKGRRGELYIYSGC
jgi:hypothetical protein